MWTSTANFAINTFTLTYTAGTGGTLTGNARRQSTTATDGTAVTAVAEHGLPLCELERSARTANPRTDTNVTADVSVTANFAINTFTPDLHGGGER